MLKYTLSILLLVISFHANSCFESKPHETYTYYYGETKDSDVGSFRSQDSDVMVQKIASIATLQAQLDQGEVGHKTTIFNVSYSHGYYARDPQSLMCTGSYSCLKSAIAHFETQDHPAIEEIFIYNTQFDHFTVDIMTASNYQRYHLYSDGITFVQ